MLRSMVPSLAGRPPPVLTILLQPWSPIAAPCSQLPVPTHLCVCVRVCRARALLEDFGLALRLLQCYAALQSAHAGHAASEHSSPRVPPVAAAAEPVIPAGLSVGLDSASPQTAAGQTFSTVGQNMHDPGLVAMKDFGEMLDVLMGPPLYPPAQTSAPGSSSTASAGASCLTPQSPWRSRLLRLTAACAAE